jgi:hypothetical protein
MPDSALPPITVQRIGRNRLISMISSSKGFGTNAMRPWAVAIMAAGASAIPTLAMRP